MTGEDYTPAKLSAKNKGAMRLWGIKEISIWNGSMGKKGTNKMQKNHWLADGSFVLSDEQSEKETKNLRDWMAEAAVVAGAFFVDDDGG